MKSMTGYAFRETAHENCTVSVEIKSYNSRFLDITVNVPPYLGSLENTLREEAAKYFLRGKVDIYVKLREKNAPVSIETDMNAAEKYAVAIKAVASALGLSSDIPLSLVVSQEGVLSMVRDADSSYYASIVLPVFLQAVSDHTRDREREGAHLKTDILAMTAKISEAAVFFDHCLADMEHHFADNLRKRFAEFASGIDEQRVAQETASLLIKYTINEEVVRLKSHLESLESEIETNPAPGRKIDFICQEINREINTIGSKNQLLEVARAVIGAKDALENIREQARNLE